VPIVGAVSAFIMASARSAGCIICSRCADHFRHRHIGVLYTMASWWADVIREASTRATTPRVQISHRYGMICSSPRR